jgi:hypothetical protein
MPEQPGLPLHPDFNSRVLPPLTSRRDFDGWPRQIAVRLRDPPLPIVASLDVLGRAVHVGRQETSAIERFDAHPPPPTISRPSVLPEPDPVAQEFRRAAREGERLEPDNACFPVTAALADLAAYRDRDALYDMERAAAAPHWTDYTRAIIEAWLRRFALAGAEPPTSSIMGPMRPHRRLTANQ